MIGDGHGDRTLRHAGPERSKKVQVLFLLDLHIDLEHAYLIYLCCMYRILYYI
jgi:hypothetical protein